MLGKKALNIKYINIIDPTFSKNNLGISISKLNSSRVKKGIKLQNDKLTQMYKMDSDSLMHNLLEVFKYSFEINGIHPTVSSLTH